MKNNVQSTIQDQTQPTNDIDQQPEVLNPVDNETMSYTLQNDEFNLTYNNGEDWLEVPIEKNCCFKASIKVMKQN